MSIAAKVGMNYFGALRKKNRPIAKIHECGVWFVPWVPQEAIATRVDESAKSAGADSRRWLFNYV
jgi:hypothetical protein